MKKYLPLILGIILGILLITFTWSYLQPYTFHGTVLQSPNPAPAFTLTAHTGEAVNLSDFRGKLVIIYFGYTFCPDVCPATLSELAEAVNILGKKADQVQVIMISVDPERDTPERLAEYVSHFDARFLGLTGDPEEIAQTAALYGIYYEKQPGTSATGYLVDHTATVVVVDQEGYLKLLLPFGVTGEEMAEDFAYMLR